MVIRPAKNEAYEIQAMAELAAASTTAAHWPPAVYWRIFEGNGETGRIALVTEENNSICAFIVANQLSGECEIENIVVADGKQRNGVGSELLSALIILAKRRSIQKIVLEVRESNAVACHLYRKFNFQQSGRRPEYYSNPAEDALLFTLAISE